MPLEPCDCCGVPVSYRRASLWHGVHRICRPCFVIWHDDGLVDPRAIKQRRLQIYGDAEDLPRLAGGMFDG